MCRVVGMDENKSAKTRSAWGRKVAHLAKEKGQEPIPQWAFIGFNLHRNTGGIHRAHQSLSGSNCQTIDNTQRTMRANSESGQIAKWPQNFGETNSFFAWTLII